MSELIYSKLLGHQQSQIEQLRAELKLAQESNLNLQASYSSLKEKYVAVASELEELKKQIKNHD